MKTQRYIVIIIALLLGRVGVGYNQDYSRVSERSIIGTARYVGMGGAMSAIGGDPSAALDNPAGLGLYQRWELLFTFDETLDYTHQVGASDKYLRSLFTCPQASLVISHPALTESTTGIQANNFMFSYHKLTSFNRTLAASGGPDASLGSTLPALDIPFCTDPSNNGNSLNLWEIGYANEYGFDWAMNIAHKWYVGLGFHIQNYELNGKARYEETFDSTNVAGKHYYNENNSSLLYTGVSCNFSVGVIYRPLQWLRLGIGLQTPTLGAMNIYTNGSFFAQTDSLRVSYPPEMAYRDKGFHMPLHLSSSVAFQIGAYGLISLQHDYWHSKGFDDIHSLRAGIEVIPVMGMYINAGYVYESTFKPATSVVPMDASFDRQDTYFLHPRQSQYASCAIGYRGPHMLVQAAYQYRWQGINLYAHEVAAPYDMHTDTHRIVLTIGWHQY